MLELLQENKELAGLLRRYGKLKRSLEEAQMQVVLTPRVSWGGKHEEKCFSVIAFGLGMW